MTQIITNNGGGGSGAGVYKYKGSVNTYEDLPSSGMKIGDVYNVVNEHTTAPVFPAGTNVAWTGTDWDALGGSIDLSDYQKKLVEGAGIDIDGDTNEISVESAVINGAAAGATAVQPGDDISDLNNDAGYITSSDIPTNVSAFNNDAGYLVSSDLKQSDWGQNDSSAIDYIKNKPTIGNATLTIQKNGTTVNTITMNATSNVTANISVPTKTSDINNDSGFITSSDIPTDVSSFNNDAGYITSSDLPDLSGYQLKSNLVTDLTNPDNTHYPSSLAVASAISSAGGGDVTGPASSTDGHLAVFDGATGKKLKDSGKKPSDYQEKLTAQTAYTAKGTSSKVPQITTNSLGQVTAITEVDISYPNQVSDIAYAASWDGVADVAPSKNAVYDKIESVEGEISTINGLIPVAATTSNQLADKDFVNNGINSVTAYYITKNANGDQFATYAELAAATTFYSGGVVRTPTRNDYTIVLADENHDNATTRYIYNSGWEYQYTVNETALTQAQLDALNSGITANKVSTYDGYATSKQNTLAGQTAYTSKGTATKVPTISTNSLGQVTSITETNISFPVTSVNGSTGAVTGLQTTANLKTGLSDNSDTYYPSQKAVKTAVDGKQDKATSGSGAPSSTPTFVGQQYIDTTNDKMYFATGTSSSSDWTLVGSGSGMGDVTGPASSTDGDLVLFDGATGKVIKDGNKKLSGLVQTSGNQSISGTKTFTTSPVVPSKTTDATNTGTAIATEAQVYKKQDKLTTQTAYTSKGTSTKVPTITTNTLGQVTGITEVSISYPSQVSDAAYSSSWNGVTTVAPSKNAVYDAIESKLGDIETLLAAI